MILDIDPQAFSIIGPRTPATPVVIAVPHAGRDYPPALRAMAAVDAGRLVALEDRFAERLTDAVATAGATLIVAHRARAWIDLNRDPREIDPRMISPEPDPSRLIQSAKLRAGLGLLPRRLPALGELWTRRVTAAELAERLAGLHRPYHDAVAARLVAARAIFGHAMLIDCHSMPPLPVSGGRPPAQIVVGDRFGRAAGSELVELVLATIGEAGFRAARNVPYAGGYTLDRHAAPARGIHAIQLEFDRTLYLDGQPGEISEGVGPCGALLALIAERLALALDDRAISLAAE